MPAGRLLALIPGRGPEVNGYVSTVPDRKPLRADLPLVSSLDRGSLSHRQVMAELIGCGWVPCGVGDWALVFVAARVLLKRDA
jgi:hypothetical protein